MNDINRTKTIRPPLWVATRFAYLVFVILPYYIFRHAAPDIFGLHKIHKFLYIAAAALAALTLLSLILARFVNLEKPIARFQEKKHTLTVTHFLRRHLTTASPAFFPFLFAAAHLGLTSLLTVMAPGSIPIACLLFFPMLLSIFITFFSNLAPDGPRTPLRRTAVRWLLFYAAVLAAVVAKELAFPQILTSPHRSLINGSTGALFILLMGVITARLGFRVYSMRYKKDATTLLFARTVTYLIVVAALLIAKLYLLVHGGFYVFMFYQFLPGTFAYVAAAFALVVVFIVARNLKRLERISLFNLCWCLVWVSLIYVQTFNRTLPSADTCSSIDTHGGELRAVLPAERYSDEPKLEKCSPYESIMDEEDGLLFVTFKNLVSHGALAMLDLERPGRLKILKTIDPEHPSLMLYPERIGIDTGEKQVFFSTKSPNNFQVPVLSYRDRKLKVIARIRFGRLETTNVMKDKATGKLLILFLPPPDSQVAVVDAETFEIEKFISMSGKDYADYFIINRDKNRLVIPSTFDPNAKFHVYEIGLDDYRLRRYNLSGGRRLRHLPVLGATLDEKRNTIYFTSPFKRSVFKTDSRNYRLRGVLPAGVFPRDLDYDPKHDLLYVGNYADGTVDVIDTRKFKRARRYFIGKLVRSIYVNRPTGRAFAVSGCGVFEIDGARIRSAARKIRRQHKK
ncbi:MAG: hypothetical protein ABIH66_14140 [bacterium]